MKNLLKFAALALLTLQVAQVVAAQEAIGKVTQVTGDDETVIVIRQSEAFALRVGDELFDKDRVIVRMATSVEIESVDCTVALQEAQSLIVSANLCDEAAALASTSDLAFIAPTTEAVGAAAPIWTLLVATGGPAVAVADILTDGNGVTESGPAIVENTTASTSP